MRQSLLSIREALLLASLSQDFVNQLCVRVLGLEKAAVVGHTFLSDEERPMQLKHLGVHLLCYIAHAGEDGLKALWKQLDVVPYLIKHYHKCGDGDGTKYIAVDCVEFICSNIDAPVFLRQQVRQDAVFKKSCEDIDELSKFLQV